MPRECREMQEKLKPRHEGHVLTLPEICQEVHEVVTGSLETDTERTSQMLAILWTAVLHWKPDPDFSAPYDNVVLSLIRTVLKEAMDRGYGPECD